MRDATTDDGRTALRPGLAWGLGLAALAGAGWTLAGLDRTGVSVGVLLLVAALGLLATAVGQGRWGPEEEGRLDLSTRLAVGMVGGLLGGLAYLVVAWLGGRVGLPGLLGSGWEVRTGAGAWTSRAAAGALWGGLFGLTLRSVPGRGPVVRGLVFSLAPTLWTLLVGFPELEYGWFGVRLGALTFVPVVLYHLGWGLVAGGCLRWARETELAPLSRPLGG